MYKIHTYGTYDSTSLDDLARELQDEERERVYGDLAQHDIYTICTEDENDENR